MSKVKVRIGYIHHEDDLFVSKLNNAKKKRSMATHKQTHVKFIIVIVNVYTSLNDGDSKESTSRIKKRENLKRGGKVLFSK
jgi:hypothetical protein